jgi:enoyl-CoA hydratase
VLTLARPERHNVISRDGWRRIAAGASAFASDRTLRAVLVRGAGAEAFGAGADIKEFPLTRMTARDAADYNDAVSGAIGAVCAIPVPVIAVIDGLAVGGGLELSAACDLRIATARSRFGLPIGRLGVTLGLTEAAALARLIGTAELKYLIVSGRLVDAARALRTGLVQQVVDDRSALVEEVVDLVAAIVAASQPTLLAAKAVVDMTTRPLTATDTERLARIAVEVYDGPDLDEGVAAFAERRPPQFPSQRAEARTATAGG